MISFVDRYVSLAGRACCCGRSWVSLDRSLARRGDDTAESSCESPTFVGNDDPEGLFVDAEREPDEATFRPTSSSL
jgi:hypothetical protein